MREGKFRERDEEVQAFTGPYIINCLRVFAHRKGKRDNQRGEGICGAKGESRFNEHPTRTIRNGGKNISLPWGGKLLSGGGDEHQHMGH